MNLDGVVNIRMDIFFIYWGMILLIMKMVLFV